jgi:hypothetical protein
MREMNKEKKAYREEREKETRPSAASTVNSVRPGESQRAPIGQLRQVTFTPTPTA